MTTLQNDLLEIYNSLVIFSDSTIKSGVFANPIKVFYEKDNRLLVFEQKGKSARLGIPTYYSLALENIQKPTYLLPEDYDYLMATLQSLIMSGDLLRERTCLSPENYGFDLYAVNLKEPTKGPDIIGKVRFVSGNSWLFKWKTKLKYNL